MTLIEHLRINVSWKENLSDNSEIDDAINRMTPLKLAEALSAALEDMREEEEDNDK